MQENIKAVSSRSISARHYYSRVSRTLPAVVRNNNDKISFYTWRLVTLTTKSCRFTFTKELSTGKPKSSWITNVFVNMITLKINSIQEIPMLDWEKTQVT